MSTHYEEFVPVEFFTSHEGLHLSYEEALTRKVEKSGLFYNLGAHFLWIGYRTTCKEGAHVEYFRGIANPIGIKVGPGLSGQDLVDLLKVLDPEKIPGKITLITRFGAQKIYDWLPAHIRAVQKARHKVVWLSDPMHGNTEISKNFIKKRNYDNILSELQSAFKIHRNEGQELNGVHLELTGDNVTECTGGPDNIVDSELLNNYTTACDPRLNKSQSLEIVRHVAQLLRGKSS
ncbi:uncharacterized protein LOC135146333 [Zophobas morio]|uniref:uncharacterized protein LOC135146333 n=1 Tax=Zophobas morio TaxID=2755281 RepID=UPI003083822D